MSEPNHTTPEHRPEELYFLPCPFCWGKARMVAHPKREHDTVAFFAAECTCCGARGPVSVGWDKARLKWNEQFNSKADGFAIAEDAIRANAESIHHESKP